MSQNTSSRQDAPQCMQQLVYNRSGQTSIRCECRRCKHIVSVKLVHASQQLHNSSHTEHCCGGYVCDSRWHPLCCSSLQYCQVTILARPACIDTNKGSSIPAAARAVVSKASQHLHSARDEHAELQHLTALQACLLPAAVLW